MMEELCRRLSLTTLVLWFCSSLAFAQDRTISGKVVDESGQPLPGVNIVVRGTTTGTVTDADGAYSLGNLNESSVLVFSFVGFDSKEIAVGTSTVINVDMTTDATT